MLKALLRLGLHGAKVRALGAVLLLGGGAALGTAVLTGSAQHGHRPSRYDLTAAGDGCRQGNPLANVYHPYRLKVRKACLTVVGTVAYIRREDDGDVHVDLKLLPSENHLLNAYNDSQQYGQLVTELVPADQPGCTPGQAPRPAHGSYDYGICTGADIHVPPLGTLVKETGPYVLDADHGWMEIHPIWRIIILRLPVPTTTAPPPATAPPPPAAPPRPEPPTTTLGGAWCKAYSVSANDGYRGDFDIHVLSDEPYTSAVAHSPTDRYGYETNAQGSAVIYLWDQTAGEAVTVVVGPATCNTRDP